MVNPVTRYNAPISYAAGIGAIVVLLGFVILSNGSATKTPHKAHPSEVAAILKAD